MESSTKSFAGDSAEFIAICNRHFHNFCAASACQCWNEPVQLAVQLNLLNNFPAVRLERGAKIVQLHAGKFSHHPVRSAAWNLSHQPVIMPRMAPATHQVVAFFDFLQESRNLVRVMLHIAVHRDDDGPARKVESRLEGRSLAEIPP